MRRQQGPMDSEPTQTGTRCGEEEGMGIDRKSRGWAWEGGLGAQSGRIGKVNRKDEEGKGNRAMQQPLFHARGRRALI